MKTSTPVGLALTLIAGTMSGNCMLPAKFARVWKWENIWAVFSVVSLILLPWAFALLLVTDLPRVYCSLTIKELAVPLSLGMGWGVAQILFGISVRRLGLGLSYAIIVGLGAVFGTLVPLFLGQSLSMDSTTIAIIIAGVLLMLCGISITAWGGRIREHRAEAVDPGSRQNSYTAAILTAVLCGFMAPMLNYSFAFGQGIAHQAIRFGTPQLSAAYAVWPVGLLGGFLPNAVYGIYLLSQNKTWNLFHQSARDALLSASMGVLWMGAFSLYGMAAVFLGRLGTSVGWGLLQIFMVVAATLSGVLTGEWKDASSKAVLFSGAGLAILTVATLFFAWSDYRY